MTVSRSTKRRQEFRATLSQAVGGRACMPQTRPRLRRNWQQAARTTKAAFSVSRRRNGMTICLRRRSEMARRQAHPAVARRTSCGAVGPSALSPKMVHYGDGWRAQREGERADVGRGGFHFLVAKGKASRGRH